MTTRWVVPILVVASPLGARGEPLFAIFDDTLVARAAGGPSWAGDDRALGGWFRIGALANRRLLAADVEVGANTASPALVTALPSIGLKLKFLSTPGNMGYTYVHAGVRG